MLLKKKKKNFIEVHLIYNAVLISAIQQSDSVTHIHTHTHTHTSFSNCVMRLQFLFLQLKSQIIKLDFKFKIVCMLPF